MNFYISISLIALSFTSCALGFSKGGSNLTSLGHFIFLVWLFIPRERKRNVRRK